MNRGLWWILVDLGGYSEEELDVEYVDIAIDSRIFAVV